MGRRGTHMFLLGKPEETKRVGRSQHTWMDLVEMEWGGVSWIDLTQDRNQWRAFVNTVMNLRVP
jgi:hypothetical protein